MREAILAIPGLAEGVFNRRDASVAEPLMRTEGLVLRRGGKTLIDGVDLTIRPGRKLFVMGANGSGKTLLLRLLHGLEAPSGGQVLWRGKLANGAAKAGQAMVFQRPVMLRRSVLANIRFALAVKGVAGGERRAREEQALAMARLEDLAHRPARVLSGGEQQRLAIARALVCAPELLFLDEPTASLDPASTAAIEELVDAAHEAGVTIVMVTHDAGQARRLADDIAFLHRGRLSEFGQADSVLAAPQSEAAQAWLEGRLYLA